MTVWKYETLEPISCLHLYSFCVILWHVACLDLTVIWRHLRLQLDRLGSSSVTLGLIGIISVKSCQSFILLLSKISCRKFWTTDRIIICRQPLEEQIHGSCLSAEPSSSFPVLAPRPLILELTLSSYRCPDQGWPTGQRGRQSLYWGELIRLLTLSSSLSSRYGPHTPRPPPPRTAKKSDKFSFKFRRRSKSAPRGKDREQGAQVGGRGSRGWSYH